MKMYKYQIPSSIQNGLNTNRIYEITIRIIERKEKKKRGGQEKKGKKVIVSYFNY